MLKKSIWGSIFASSALALAFAIYTVVAIATGFGVKKSNSVKEVTVALRVNDEFVVESGKTTFEGLEGEVKKNKDGKYIAKLDGDGTFKCTVTKSNNSKIIYTVTVYDYGTGAITNPYNITKASDLLNLDGNNKSIYSELESAYALRADIDLAGINWIPVGTRFGRTFADQISTEGEGDDATYELREGDLANTRFKGVFNGNGYKILNLSIDITEQDFNDFALYQIDPSDDGKSCLVDGIYLDIGFFGYVDGATITNVVFENATVKMDAKILKGEFTAQYASDDFTSAEVNVLDEIQAVGNVDFGVAFGSVAYSDISKITITGSSLTAGTNEQTLSGIGLLAGISRQCNISNITIEKSQISANAKMTRTGGLVGGIDHILVGSSFIDIDDSLTQRTTVSNVNISEVTISGDANELSSTGGVAAVAYGATFENINIDKLTIKLLNNGSENTTAVAGAVAKLFSITTKNGTELTASMNNVSVNANIEAKDAVGAYNDAAGVVYVNGGTITNAKFSGEITAKDAAGIALINEKAIAYTEDFEGTAVDVTANIGNTFGGVVCYNFGGTVLGTSSDNKTKVLVVFNSFRTVAPAEVVEECVVGGIAAYFNNGQIKNFDVEITSAKAINFGGAVGYAGIQYSGITKSSLYKFTESGDNTICEFGPDLALNGNSTLSDIAVKANVATKIRGNGTFSQYVGGIAAKIASKVTVENVSVDLTVNKYAEAAEYGVSGYIIAGLIAEVEGTESILVDGADVKVDIFVNETSRQINNKYISIAAGAMGLVKGKGITISNINVKNSTITNMVGDGKDSDSVDHSSGSYAFIALATGTEANGISVNNITVKDSTIAAHYNASNKIVSTQTNTTTGEDVEVTNVTCSSQTNQVNE